MKISEEYKGFLEAEDIPEGKEIPVEILSVRRANNKDKGLDGQVLEVPIVKLKSVKKEWVLKTNARIIRRKLGNETDGWTGKKIIIFRTTCNAFGKKVACIRVREEVKKGF